MSFRVQAILQESLMNLPKYQQMDEAELDQEIKALAKLVVREDKAKR